MSQPPPDWGWGHRPPLSPPVSDTRIAAAAAFLLPALPTAPDRRDALPNALASPVLPAGQIDPTVCIEQAALKSLKYVPGPIDGVDGPNTAAARTHSMSEWGLQNVSAGSVDYWQTLGRALDGNKPSGSRPK